MSRNSTANFPPCRLMFWVAVLMGLLTVIVGIAHNVAVVLAALKQDKRFLLTGAYLLGRHPTLQHRLLQLVVLFVLLC